MLGISTPQQAKTGLAGYPVRRAAQTPAKRLNFLLLPSPHSIPSRRSVAQGRLRLFTTDASRRIFESALERVRRSFKLHVYGYVVMPEHVHLLLSEPEKDTLADALKSLNKEYRDV